MNSIFGGNLEKLFEKLDELGNATAKASLLNEINLGLEVALVSTNVCCFFLAAFCCTSIVRLIMTMKCVTLSCSSSINIAMLSIAISNKGTSDARDRTVFQPKISEFLALVFTNWHQCLSLIFLHAIHRKIAAPLIEESSMKREVKKCLLALLFLFVVTGVEKGVLEAMPQGTNDDAAEIFSNRNTTSYVSRILLKCTHRPR